MLGPFIEAYHIRTLHRDAIGKYFDSGATIFEAFGPHLVNIGFRKSLFDELAKPVSEQRRKPYATMPYFLVPNAMLCYQVDHVELWRLEPIDVHTTKVTTSAFTDGGLLIEKSDRYLRRNLDLLLDVTGREDFPLIERIRATLDSGALPEVIYGRIEPALAHCHESIETALEAGGLG